MTMLPYYGRTLRRLFSCIYSLLDLRNTEVVLIECGQYVQKMKPYVSLEWLQVES